MYSAVGTVACLAPWLLLLALVSEWSRLSAHLRYLDNSLTSDLPPESQAALCFTTQHSLPLPGVPRSHRSTHCYVLGGTTSVPGTSPFASFEHADEQFLPWFLGLSAVAAYTGKVALGSLRQQRLAAGGKP